jgi:hypothetical protein
MSYNDLMDAYKRGRISRRSFIRGMVAVGVSAVVAERLASQVEAAPAGRSAGWSRYIGEDVYDDVYGEPELPATGAGSSSEGGLSVKFLAIGGAAAAAGAALLRRVKGSEAPAE